MFIFKFVIIKYLYYFLKPFSEVLFFLQQKLQLKQLAHFKKNYYIILLIKQKCIDGNKRTNTTLKKALYLKLKKNNFLTICVPLLILVFLIKRKTVYFQVYIIKVLNPNLFRAYWHVVLYIWRLCVCVCANLFFKLHLCLV